MQIGFNNYGLHHGRGRHVIMIGSGWSMTIHWHGLCQIRLLLSRRLGLHVGPESFQPEILKIKRKSKQAIYVSESKRFK
jgi:hypothetical protein